MNLSDKNPGLLRARGGRPFDMAAFAAQVLASSGKTFEDIELEAAVAAKRRRDPMLETVFDGADPDSGPENEARYAGAVYALPTWCEHCHSPVRDYAGEVERITDSRVIKLNGKWTADFRNLPAVRCPSCFSRLILPAVEGLMDEALTVQSEAQIQNACYEFSHPLGSLVREEP